MVRSSKKTYLKKRLACLISLTYLLFSTQSFADTAVLDRIRQCSPLGGMDNTTTQNPAPGRLDYSIVNGGKDFLFDVSNGYCWITVAPSYVAVKAAVPYMNSVCGSGSPVPRPFPSPLQDALDLGRAHLKAVSVGPVCLKAAIISDAALGSFLAAMKIQHELADEARKNSYLCGSGGEDNWMKWNSKLMTKNIPDKKGKLTKSGPALIESCQNGNENLPECLDYRQWYFGGVEREDNSEDPCPDVNQAPQLKASSSFSVQYGDKFYPPQKYYMRGSEPGNYACQRYNYRYLKNDPVTKGPLSPERQKSYVDAHQCCINKSKSTICIDRSYCKSGGWLSTCPSMAKTTEHKFCRGGTECSIGSPNKVIYSSRYGQNNRMICAKTANLCPYDFNLGLGSNECDYYKDGHYEKGKGFIPIDPEDIEKGKCEGKSEVRNNDCSMNSKAGKCKNYCQLLNHCVIVGANDYVYDTSIVSPYFSSACLNFVGDSKNEYGYDTGIFAGTQRHFSAPIVQCVRETLENIFYNRAGHTKCAIYGEYPDSKGECYTKSYEYQKDKPVNGVQSFFSRLQDGVRGAIKMALTISIMMMGYKILLTGTPLKHPEIIMYIVKVSLIMFFATSNAWQGYFFDGVYNASTSFSSIVTNIKTSKSESGRDGCQFGKITMPDSTKTVVAEYPDGKNYLAIFDALDCKIALYLGFGPSASVANIAKLALASLLSSYAGAIGVFFAIAVIAFGFLLVIAAFRAVHIFLASAFSIILLVYISPITITASLFKKTEGLFNRWLGQLLGISLQPILLFAYIGIFITVFETLMIGSATFAGKPPQKTLICDKICLDANGNKKFSESEKEIGACEIENGDKILDPMSDSVACMINLKNEQFGSIPVLEPLGIAIPILVDFFSEKGREKILTILKALLIIYILTKFMDEIPNTSSNLMGGKGLPGSQVGVNDLGKVHGATKGVESRVAGGTKQLGKALTRFVKRE
ncbi:MAG: TrbL/VirB6 plasmid conjugal transfer protein [Rickettsiaceae bacterium]|jgi:hypothetical protein|nr:TrbL/VirB6 plasmid conjugal transfer protein [Rickettsiaceae bacterium]